MNTRHNSQVRYASLYYGAEMDENIAKEVAHNVSKYKAKLEALPDNTRAKVKESVHDKLRVQYVLMSNICDKVGTQTLDETRLVLNGSHSSASGQRTRKQKESTNTARALDEMDAIFAQAQRAGTAPSETPVLILLPENLKRVHEFLIQHDEDRLPGQIRDCLVMTDEDSSTMNCSNPTEVVIRKDAAIYEVANADSDPYQTVLQIFGKKLGVNIDCSKKELEKAIISKLAEILLETPDALSHTEKVFDLYRCGLLDTGDPLYIALVGDEDDSARNTEKALHDLSKYFDPSEPIAIPSMEDALRYHEKLVPFMQKSKIYVYPLLTKAMLLKKLQGLYEKVREMIKSIKGTNYLETAKVAAYSLFEFVDLHPFCDGNGRMARLIACGIMSIIAPFPCGITIAQESTDSKLVHKTYVKAICNARKDPNRNTGQLGSMILEGAYHCSDVAMESIKNFLCLGKIACDMSEDVKLQRQSIKSDYHQLPHSRRPVGYQEQDEVKQIISSLDGAVPDTTIPIEFSDGFLLI